MGSSMAACWQSLTNGCESFCGYRPLAELVCRESLCITAHRPGPAAPCHHVISFVVMGSSA